MVIVRIKQNLPHKYNVWAEWRARLALNPALCTVYYNNSRALKGSFDVQLMFRCHKLMRHMLFIYGRLHSSYPDDLVWMSVGGRGAGSAHVGLAQRWQQQQPPLENWAMSLTAGTLNGVLEYARDRIVNIWVAYVRM